MTARALCVVLAVTTLACCATPPPTQQRQVSVMTEAELRTIGICPNGGRCPKEFVPAGVWDGECLCRRVSVRKNWRTGDREAWYDFEPCLETKP